MINNITLSDLAPYFGLTPEQFALAFVFGLGILLGVGIYSLYSRWDL